ncbi:ABC transporter substrate-binding protein [Paenibacillus chungangensis]|uniref:ABC transporter substrate-binding protein n=1 Tax=Paenibacillus chungangensis TaxID=696535 RepID=A0ABW3HJX5_9BACL
MKKTSFKLLAVLMVLTLIVAGCGSKNDGNSASPGSGSGNNSAGEAGGKGQVKSGIKLTEPGNMKVSEEKVTLKVMVGAKIEGDYNTNWFTQWLEEQTNVHVEWEVVPKDSMAEKLNLALASGDYPDVIMNMKVNLTQQQLYGSQGIFLPLNELIEEHGVETKKALTTLEDKDQYYSLDGNIYSLPSFNDCYHCNRDQKLWIYKPWLDKLNLEMPQTTDQLYEVLKAFKEQDPNGNGKADEIPYAGAVKDWQSSVHNFLMNAFIFTDTKNQFKFTYLNGDKVDIIVNKPEFKEGLGYMRKLYQEGLIAPETFTQKREQLRQLGDGKGDPILGAFPSGWMASATYLNGESGRWLEYVTVPALEGPSGTRYAGFGPYAGIIHGDFIITDKAKHPEVALRWGDNFFREEVMLRALYGKEGENWRYAQEGEKGINGEPAKYVILERSKPEENIIWDQSMPSVRTAEFRLGEGITDPETNLEYILYHESKNNYDPYVPDKSMILPPLLFSKEQSSELLDLQTTLDSYMEEMIAKFIIGQANIEAEWDAYLKTLDNMKLERYLGILQEAYDSRY